MKYADLKFTNGEYGITEAAYEKLKHGIEADETILWKPIGRNSEFRFSLYRNDRVKVVDDKGEEIELLFGSRAGNNEGYVEMKPIHKARFDVKEKVAFYGQISGTQFGKKMTKQGYKLYKVNTDILGNPYYTEKESDQPKLKIKN